MTPQSVLVAAREAGAASALTPVVGALIAEGTLRPQIVAWGNALAVFDAVGLPVLAFPEDPEPREIEELLVSTNAAVVLTGTSLRAELDGRFWAAARAAGIPSVALLDHWKNYAERFTIVAPFDVLPTLVAVMDDVAERELVALGCPGDRIRVTGQPRFDALPGAVTPQLRARARQTLGIGPSRRVAAFASEPRGIPYDDGLGFTQADAVSAFLDGVEAVAPDMLAIVKLHPLEEVEPVRAAASGRARPEARILRAYPTRELAAAADVFCGMTSIVLLDAALLGVPTVSIRPGGGASHFVDLHADLITSAVTPAELRAALEQGLARKPALPARRPFDGSTARVGELLHELVTAVRIMGA